MPPPDRTGPLRSGGAVAAVRSGPATVAAAVPIRPSDRTGEPFLEPVVDVATHVGPLLLPAGDQVITRVLQNGGVWETQETAYLIMTLLPGQTFVDIGAHVGYFSVLASKRLGPTGTVIAFEPEARNLDLLERNLWRNGCGNAVVVPHACSDRSEALSLVLDEENRGAHYLVPPGHGDVAVSCVRPDQVLPDAVDVVKIDAQGYDHEVVSGLSRTWTACPDLVIMVELSYGELDRRGIEPVVVLGGYEEMGFELAMFDAGGHLPVMPAEAIDAVCRTLQQADITVVLHRKDGAVRGEREVEQALPPFGGTR